ncbi:hybrid sensor histidine kinase/response regulator transcription factor [Larkinella punicea]|uniref:histidine kinase n=1 Tax=Larkinella punicea TaxID=2315727 RepID=A0A368JI51_9BACT|nr:two-component regulator propeller domain-containing protein [Larkinella punicea]RCR67348.1 helix-turn-helix domain-containing protein [Larkinella punicea]
MKTVSLVTGLFFCCCLLANAQQFAASVKHYGPENGLSHREVNAIFQDRQGMMWFGTKFGLNRFDGKTFTTFTKDRNGLDFDNIQSIAQDAEGNLWLMGAKSQTNVTVFNPLTNQATSFQKKFEKQQFSTSFTDLQGLSSSDNGTIYLTNYQPAALLSYHPTSGLRVVSLPQFKTLGTFRATAHHTVWAIADENRVVELTADGRILHQFSHGKDVVSWCFGKQNAGIEFFYTVYNPAQKQNHRFYSVDESGHRREWSPALLESMKRYMGPVCYPFDRTGLVWDGISLRDSTNHTLLTIAGQTSGEIIENRDFYRDQNGQFWLGTSFGVYQVKLTKNPFHRFFYQENNKAKQVATRGITVVGDQVFANLEKLGLFAIPRQGGLPKKLYGNTVFAYGLTSNEQGKIYAGNGNQLVQYIPPSDRYTTLQLPKSFVVWALHPLSPEHWLVGTPNGLQWVDTKNGLSKPFTAYHQFPELAQAHVLHIAPDRQGTIWICSNAGLYVVDPAKGITARYWSGGKGGFYLPADNFQHFYQDAKGIYWLATANSGLIRWDRPKNRFRQFRRSEGLSNDNIYAVYPDRRGNLWMSSDYGVMRFDPARLTTRTYFVQDGITHNEFNRISHFQDKTGRIYFGGLNGITAFDPRDFEAEKPPIPPPMRIISFRQFDPSLDKLIDKTGELLKTNEIVLEPGDRTSVLDFALLNYTDAEKNVYAYQFKGLDQDWTVQTESSLRLGNLAYGTYQLLIKGQAANGQWSANTLTIQVEVRRPFYLQIWFIILTVLLLIAGIWGWLRWRIWNHQQEQKRLQTEIRQATAQIQDDKEIIARQAQVLQRLNETKSRFFANISHEFRTPLTVILGMSSEMKRYDPSNRIRRASDLIERNGGNLLRLINQILDLSKLEAGEMQLQPIRADLVNFARYLAESFHSMATLKGIQLHFRTDVETCETDFDRDKLQDILSNLLTNALKFTPAGGDVYFHLATHATWNPPGEGFYKDISPTKHLGEPWFSIRVRDTGPGIEPESLRHIFDRFFQGTTRPDSETGGTGIGLSLVRELVLLMNGGLAVWSLPGAGAEFVVSFPRTQKAPPTDVATTDFVLISPENRAETEPVISLAGDKPVLLLVEDNKDVATYIISCLRNEYRIIRGENGQMGIDLAFSTIPDLILSDVMMPQKDGFQLCDELKNDPRTSHIPIVLLTAKAAASDRISGLRRGADAYLTKPFQREELLVVLENRLQSRRVMQAYYSQLALKTAPDDPAVTEETDSLESLFLLKLRSALEEQLDNPDFSIEAICQQMRMSRSTLHLKLVALTGMSTTRYIRALRLGKAKELLVASDLNISEVAYAVGFEDPKYFSRVFSDEFGISPANFRLSAHH